MAIFQKAYRGYDGPLAPPWHRVLVIFRYALADVFRSRLFAGFFAICFLLPLALMVVLYGYYNLELLLQFDVPVEELSMIDGTAFALFMQLPQLVLIFVMVMTIGPTMISPDLRNNAMPLYLSRPIGRSSYLVGKLLVLLFLGSLISWVPGLLLVGLQAFLGPPGWLWDHYYIPLAAVVTSLIWIVSLSLVAFVISAFVKWKALARIEFFGVLFFASVVGAIVEDLFGGWSGQMINVGAAINTMVSGLYRVDASQVDIATSMPLWATFVEFALIAGLAWFILAWRIRAFQGVS